MSNPFKTIQNICSTILTVIFLYWFGTSAFKLGFYASEIPIMSALVRTLIEDKTPEGENKDSWIEKTWQFIKPQQND